MPTEPTGIMPSKAPRYQLDSELEAADAKARSDLARLPEVFDADDDFNPWSETFIEAPKWFRIEDAVAVVIDLRNSTLLGLNKRAASTASIYDAATGTAVQLLGKFGPNFVAIQGDGAFGLYWGERRYERALCAGITVKTFSEHHLVPQLQKKWPVGLPETGFKVGLAASPLLVKRIGIPRSDHQEPVWPGKAVNYATKAAQAAAPNKLVVTDRVWRYFENNDYVAYSCGCNSGPSFGIWGDLVLEVLPLDEPDRLARVLNSTWCRVHGEEFCNAICGGATSRDDVQRDLRNDRISSLKRNSLRLASDRAYNIRRGLAS